MSNPLSRLKMKKTNPQKLKKIQIRIQTGVTTTDEDGKTVPVKSKIVDATEEDFDIVAFKNKLAESRQNKFSSERASAKVEVDDDKTEPKSKTVRGTSVGKTTRKPRKKKEIQTITLQVPATQIQIGDNPIQKRLKQKEPVVRLKLNAYYMNNRSIFTNFINSFLQDYKNMDDANFTNKDGSYSLFLHQQIIRDYINIYTPYRGLLLYHGLGAGKTCGSIAIAEGLKHSDKEIFIMTPASLRRNYIEELKKCGDPLYKTNQFWEEINVSNNPHLEQALSEVLSLDISYIRKRGKVWMVNVNKKPNYSELSTEQKLSLDKQINQMIRSKYHFENYNGLRKSHLKRLEDEALEKSGGASKNPFSHKVVIIDEAHNFVSLIVNKLRSKKSSLSKDLYEYLMDAEDCRIVFLTGTPIINYPNEIAILYNILRGYIKTHFFKIEVEKKEKVTTKTIINRLKNTSLADYIEYKPSTKVLAITRNPFSFTSRYNKNKEYKGVGVSEKEYSKYSDTQFRNLVVKALKRGKVPIYAKYVTTKKHKSLPDDLDDFNQLFISSLTGKMINTDLFKRRILGLTSYFRSAKESLLPKFDINRDIIVERIIMSDYQLKIYEEARASERKEEIRNARKNKGSNIFSDDSTSTYRIFSRAFCNFVFPEEIKRPMPGNKTLKDSIEKKKLDEDAIDNASVKDRVENMDGRFSLDDATMINKELVSDDYASQIKSALKLLKANSSKFLSEKGLETYSPKFKKIIFNLNHIDNVGTHLIYSQFRTLEGVGILKLVLEENGYSEFKISRNSSGNFFIDMTDEELAKPSFALYTGTEDNDTKEIVRNIFNGTWNGLPVAIKTKLEDINKNNNFGEIIKIFMITSSGAEGITLQNTRFVHIVEPYWHPVRSEQVIGRARRINSHINLPEEYRTVKVFKYIMVFSDLQLKGNPEAERDEDKKPKVSATLINKDLSKRDKLTPISTDQALFEISNIKKETINDILYELKNSSIDCSIHSNESENLNCYSYRSQNTDSFITTQDVTKDQTDDVSQLNKERVGWEGYEFTYDGVKYAVQLNNPDNPKDRTGKMYTYDSYQKSLESNSNPIHVGNIIKHPKNPNKYSVRLMIR